MWRNRAARSAGGPLGRTARRLGGGGRAGRACRDDQLALAESLPARGGRGRHGRGERIFVPPGVLPAGSRRAACSASGRPVAWAGDFPASLGIKLASPGKQVVALLGDGAYMFANPTACHFIAENQKLPVLTVIYNNALYGAVRRATLDMYDRRRRGRGGRPAARRSAQLRRSSGSSRRMADTASGWNIRPTCRRRSTCGRRRCAAGSRRW